MSSGSPDPRSPIRILLIGAGHAHVEVLRRAAARRQPGVEWMLAVDQSPALYSGMLPGLVAGQYRPADLEIDAAALARRAGAELVLEPVRRIDDRRHCALTVSGRELGYDLASLDVGSGMADADLPGVAQHALCVRPLPRFVASLPELLARARSAPREQPFRLLVVGAGAGGVELALCFEARLRAETGGRAEVTLLDRAASILAGAEPGLARRASRALARRGVRVELAAEVEGLEPGSARLRSGRRLPADAVIWSPGPAAHSFLRESGLPVDERGFVRIRPTLEVEGSDRLFAVGDCASLPGMPKAGVYAVRGGPILAENLGRRAEGRSLRVYRPQRGFLSLLNFGDGTAAGAWRGIGFEGRWAMRLKDRIDRRYLEEYR
jgi:selenide,water dikinase